MDQQVKESMELRITNEAKKKAEELGIQFKVVYQLENNLPMITIHIKKDSENTREFAEYMGDLIFENAYCPGVHYVYPSVL